MRTAFPLPVTRTGSVTEMFDAFRKDPFIGQSIESVEQQLADAEYKLTKITERSWDSWEKKARIHTWYAFYDFFHIYHNGRVVVSIEHWEKHRTSFERFSRLVRLMFSQRIRRVFKQ